MSVVAEGTVYNGIRSVVLAAANQIPVVGWLGRAIIKVLWPKEEQPLDVWDSIKAQVEAAIGTAISREVYQRVTAELTGIRDVLAAYNASPTQDTLTSALMVIRGQLPTFQEKGQEVQLLPLFIQAANVYLMMLREGIVNSEALQLAPADRTALQSELTEKISALSDYTTRTYKTGLPGASDWKKQNGYIRAYTLSVLDFLPYWPLLDPSTHAAPAVTQAPKLTREIFSDPYGDGGFAFTDAVIAATDLQAQDGQITHITIYGRHDVENWIQGAQVTYGTKKADKVGSGVSSGHYGAAAQPFDDGVGRLRTTAPYGGEIPVGDLNPVTEAWGYAGDTDDIVYGMGFTFRDGTRTPLMGEKSASAFSVGYPGEILTNISGLGVSSQKLINGLKGWAMGRVVFGFRRADSYPLTTRPLFRLHKRTSLGDVYDFVNNQGDYDARIAAGWTGQGIVATLLDSSGDIGLFVARNTSNADIVRLFVGADAYSTFADDGWSMDGALGYLLDQPDRRFGPTLPLYVLAAGSPERTMIAFDQRDFEAQQAVGWHSEGVEGQRYVLAARGEG